MKKIFYILMITLLMLTLVACSQTVVAPEETNVEVEITEVEINEVEISESEITELIIEEEISELQIEEPKIEEPQIEEPLIEEIDEAISDETVIEVVEELVIDDVIISEPQSSELVKTIDYTAPVAGIAGEATLLNFLATALEPVGTTLYIYGGGWNYEDTGGSELTSSLGIAQSWVDFFNQQNADYVYRDDENKSESYYPYEGKNTYFELGLDCSGYIGWVIYNTLHDENLEADYVSASTTMAKKLSSEYGYGTWSNTEIRQSDLKVGDIFSMQGHVWLCLGSCEDGSTVILHSTPSPSINGNLGGGVQISAIGRDTKCQAYELANYYMAKYYPQWSQRYEVVLKDYADYGSLGTSEVSGRFSWNLDGTVFSDEVGVANMTAEKILKLLFKE